MTPDQVIAKLRAWHNARVNESDTFYNDMADAVGALQKRLIELEGINVRLNNRCEMLGLDIAALREQRVLYVEIDANGPEIIDIKKYRVFTDGAWYVVEVPPRTDANTVPLKKEPSVVEQAAYVIWETAPPPHGKDSREAAKHVADALNAAGLIRKDGE